MKIPCIPIIIAPTMITQGGTEFHESLQAENHKSALKLSPSEISKLPDIAPGITRQRITAEYIDFLKALLSQNSEL